MNYLNERNELVLAALDSVPLDRMRLTKTLFLVWHLNGRKTDFPFPFRPYLYGPFSNEIYHTLDGLQREGLVAPEPDVDVRWARLYLTAKGEKQVSTLSVDSDTRQSINTIARWASEQSFDNVLRYVYSEAPDFATKSIVRDRL